MHITWVHLWIAHALDCEKGKPKRNLHFGGSPIGATKMCAECLQWTWETLISVSPPELWLKSSESPTPVRYPPKIGHRLGTDLGGRPSWPSALVMVVKSKRARERESERERERERVCGWILQRTSFGDSKSSLASVSGHASSLPRHLQLVAVAQPQQLRACCPQPTVPYMNNKQYRHQKQIEDYPKPTCPMPPSPST